MNGSLKNTSSYLCILRPNGEGINDSVDKRESEIPLVPVDATRTVEEEHDVSFLVTHYKKCLKVRQKLGTIKI